MVLEWAKVGWALVMNAINRGFSDEVERGEGIVLPLLFLTLKIISICFKMILSQKKGRPGFAPQRTQAPDLRWFGSGEL